MQRRLSEILSHCPPREHWLTHHEIHHGEMGSHQDAPIVKRKCYTPCFLEYVDNVLVPFLKNSAASIPTIALDGKKKCTKCRNFLKGKIVTAEDCTGCSEVISTMCLTCRVMYYLTSTKDFYNLPMVKPTHRKCDGGWNLLRLKLFLVE